MDRMKVKSVETPTNSHCNCQADSRGTKGFPMGEPTDVVDRLALVSALLRIVRTSPDGVDSGEMRGSGDY